MARSVPIEVWVAQYKAAQALAQSVPLLHLAKREARARTKAAQRKRREKKLRKRAKLRALLAAAKRFTEA
jgi:hypothetical protein